MSYYLSICAIVKNEAPYIEEWIAFHVIKGVQHFFIYDNESTDGTLEILKRFEKQHFLTVETIKGKAQQFPAYEKFLQDHSDKTRWAAFIDCDEFLFADKKLPDFLREYEDYGALAVNWILYGSKDSGGELVIERFRHRDKDVNPHVKSIVQLQYAYPKVWNPHHFKLKEPAVNENKETLPAHYALTENPTAKRIRINHYHTKTKAEYIKRKRLLRVSTGTPVKNIEEFFNHHDKNDIEDPFPVETELSVYLTREHYRKAYV